MTRTRALVHYHIFKNAGSSVDASLKRSFGEAWGSFEGSHAHDIQGAEQLRGYMLAHPGYKAISSHLARPPLPFEDSLPIVFIRHPLLRAYSVYLFTRRDPQQPFAEVAANVGFADYIRRALREEAGSIVIRDYQVVHLSEASWRCGHILEARAGEADLAEACALLDRWGMAGVVEQYERSIDTYQALYAPLLPGLKLAYDRENVSQPDAASVPAQLERLEALLGRELHARFMASNALDLALHRHASAVLARASRPAGQGDPLHVRSYTTATRS
ncbi:hypothetical protein KK141_01935 [Dyella sp. LX-66]|uniref:hypothetical protein n=1 Tax=unclassified Dyella TaxID=2634549 RepID=UPI001BE02B5A|nr:MULTISPECIES: hypothetical protein [unclassified Dyella]MBT2117227.1 hypothetical protein [Dyella sp. LX-1]MBT2138291.1 hypothetical protein [Dyella sp. LX-66]